MSRSLKDRINFVFMQVRLQFDLMNPIVYIEVSGKNWRIELHEDLNRDLNKMNRIRSSLLVNTYKSITQNN